jgi:hypothetical protein
MAKDHLICKEGMKHGLFVEIGFAFVGLAYYQRQLGYCGLDSL